jgi:hypothetical protein
MPACPPSNSTALGFEGSSQHPADKAAMIELGRIIGRYLSIDAAFDAALGTLRGCTGTSYWETRPQHPLC